MTVRSAPAGLVARALARSWRNRPIRLAAAAMGGIGGVLLTTAILTIALPVLALTRVPPVEGVAEDVVAVAARAPAGLSGELATRVADESGAVAASQLLVASTTVRTADRDFTPVVVLGVDAALPSMLEQGAGDAAGAVVADPPGPGEVALAREWAERHGVGAGDDVAVTTPAGTQRWRVAALLDGDLANNGAVLLAPLATVATAFDRGTSVDVLLLRPGGDGAGTGSAAVRERAAAIVDGAADVEPPHRIFASYGRIFRTPLMVVSTFAVIAVLTGGVVLFLAWRLAIADARPILSRLRLLGVRSGDLLLGSGLVLLPVLAATFLVGGSAGYLVGRSLSSFRRQLSNFTGLALEPSSSATLPLLGALVAAVAMFGFAWLSGLWHLRRTTAIDAVSGRDTTTLQRSHVRLPIAAGLACFAVAVAIGAVTSRGARVAAVVPLLLGCGTLSAVAPVLLGSAIRRSSRGPSGLLVGRQLEVEWRRNAALAITFAVALLSSVTMFGVASSIRHAMDTSNDRWTQGDLYVQAAPLGENLAGERFPASLRDEVAALPGVEATNTLSYTYAVVNGGRNLVETVGGDAQALTDVRVVAGSQDMVDGSRSIYDRLGGDDIVISTNFANTQGLDVDSTVELPVPGGHRTARVVAVIDDSVSDGGALMLGPDLYEEVAGSSRVFYVGARLAPGADEDAVRQELEALVGDRYPRAVVQPVEDYRAAVSSLLGRLMISIYTFAWVMFGIAAVVGTATLASNIAERGRGVALTRLVGGRSRSMRRLLGIEAVVTAVTAWLVAVPAALLAIPAVIGGQSAMSGLLPDPRVPVGMIGLSLPLTVLAVTAAVFVARRSLSEVPLAEIVADE